VHPWATPIICAGLGFLGGAGIFLAIIRVALRTPGDMPLYTRIRELTEMEIR